MNNLFVNEKNLVKREENNPFVTCANVNNFEEVLDSSKGNLVLLSTEKFLGWGVECNLSTFFLQIKKGCESAIFTSDESNSFENYRFAIIGKSKRMYISADKGETWSALDDKVDFALWFETQVLESCNIAYGAFIKDSKTGFTYCNMLSDPRDFELLYTCFKSFIGKD